MDIRLILFLMISGLLCAAAPEVPDDAHPEAWYKQHLLSQRAALSVTPGRTDATIDWDFRFVELDLSPDLSDASLQASAQLCFSARRAGLDAITLNLDSDLSVDLVEPAATWSHSQDSLRISLAVQPDSAEWVCVRIDYHGTPENTGFGTWKLDQHAGVPILSTLSEPSGARNWWPCMDTPADKADSARVRITVPLGFVPTSNGTLSAVDTLGGTHRWTWFEAWPIAPYLISLAITNYELIEDSYLSLDGTTTMPVHHYVWPEDREQAEEDFNVTVPMLGFFASLYGEYPFIDEKYGHSEFPWGGAMEHQCNTSYGNGLIRGDHVYDRIVAHELAHQWWGDMITCASWADIWLNEGFATYSEALWAEHVGGGHAALVNFMNSRCAVTDPSGPIHDPPSTFSSNTVYRKGAWLLHMVRGTLGDELFFDLLRSWGASEFRYASAHVDEFTSFIEAASGRDLSGLWDGFLYGMNRPEYRVDWQPRVVGGVDLLELRLEQLQAEDVFRLELPVRITAGAEIDVVMKNDLRVQSVLWPLPEAATQLALDPDDWLLETHAPAALGEEFHRVAARVKHLDGSWASALRGRISQGELVGEWVDGLGNGLISVETGEHLPGWSSEEPLQLRVESSDPLRPLESLELELPAGLQAWTDLGELQLASIRPWLWITFRQNDLLLQWSPVSAVGEYRVESRLPGEPWAAIHTGSVLEWVVPAEQSVRLFRIIALSPDQAGSAGH